jgi:hypothetical protein
MKQGQAAKKRFQTQIGQWFVVAWRSHVGTSAPRLTQPASFPSFASMVIADR